MLTGVDTVLNNMKRLKANVKRASREAIEDEISQISAESRSDVPVRSGRLKRSHTSRVDVTATGVRGQVGFGKGAPYAAPVNRRTGFFDQAVDEDRFRQRIERKVREAIK